MIIEESGLLRAMKEAYKSGGYHVAAEIDEAGIENIVITTASWIVIAEKKAMPRKVLGLIVEHIGEIPRPGEAFQIKKKEPQTEIFEVVQKSIRCIHMEGDILRTVKRTDLQLGSFRLWQRKEDMRIFKLSTSLEDIVQVGYGPVHMIRDEKMMLRDMESRVYLSVEISQGPEQERLDHLAEIQWA